MDRSALVEAMRNPDFYPHSLEKVEFIQTHLSSLFLTGDLAYKRKKPVDFGFLDFSTEELRRLNCEKELRPNPRLVPITIEERRPALDTPGEPADWVVVMRQLDQEPLGPRLLEAGRLSVRDIDALVDILVLFCEAARAGPEVDHWGRPEVFRFATDENFQQTAANV